MTYQQAQQAFPCHFSNSKSRHTLQRHIWRESKSGRFGCNSHKNPQFLGIRVFWSRKTKARWFCQNSCLQSLYTASAENLQAFFPGPRQILALSQSTSQLSEAQKFITRTDCWSIESIESVANKHSNLRCDSLILHTASAHCFTKDCTAISDQFRTWIVTAHVDTTQSTQQQSVCLLPWPWQTVSTDRVMFVTQFQFRKSNILF